MAAAARNPLAALVAEAAGPGDDGTPPSDEELERRVQDALACPCVADLRDGPCGPQFVAAFSCFLRAQARPDPGGVQAPGCLGAFGSLQQCMVHRPEAFADFVKSKAESDADQDAAAAAVVDGLAGGRPGIGGTAGGK